MLSVQLQTVTFKRKMKHLVYLTSTCSETCKKFHAIQYILYVGDFFLDWKIEISELTR